jgi:hypothetical protein
VPLRPRFGLRPSGSPKGKIVARYVELVRCQFSQAMGAAILLVMRAVLVKDFAGAFSSSGKCSVMLVPARGAAAALGPVNSPREE